MARPPGEKTRGTSRTTFVPHVRRDSLLFGERLERRRSTATLLTQQRVRQLWAIRRLSHASASLEEVTEKRRNPLETWRRMARIVRMLCTVCIALRKYAMEAGLLDNYMVSVASRRMHKTDDNDIEQDLSFDIEDFKLNKEAKVPRTLVKLLEKPPTERTDQDIHAIANLMRNLASFRKHTHEMQLLMCSIVRYMQCGRRRVVLRKGHLGYSVYFIFSGSVSVVLDKDDQNIFVKTEKVTLKKGACFGEIALTQNTRRTATVVCGEQCEFLVIDKEDYLDNGLDRKMQEEIKHRFDFFRGWSALEHWSDRQINALSYVSRTEDFNHNKVLIRDSLKNEWLWFIVHGSCDILRLVDLEKSPDYSQILSLHTTNRERYFTSPEPDRRYQLRAQSAPHAVKYRSQPKRSGVRPSTVLGNHRLSADSVESYNSEVSDSERATRLAQALFSSTESIPRKRASIVSRRSSSTDRSCDSGQIRTGIYVRVDTLRDGMCFGLDDMFAEHPTSHLSVVSKGCTVIHMPRAHFHDMADSRTLNLIKLMLKSYPSDRKLCDKFLEKSKWDSFKDSVVEEVIEDYRREPTKLRASHDFPRIPSTNRSISSRRTAAGVQRTLSTLRSSVQFATPGSRRFTRSKTVQS